MQQLPFARAALNSAITACLAFSASPSVAKSLNPVVNRVDVITRFAMPQNLDACVVQLRSPKRLAASGEPVEPGTSSHTEARGPYVVCDRTTGHPDDVAVLVAMEGSRQASKNIPKDWTTLPAKSVSEFLSANAVDARGRPTTAAEIAVTKTRVGSLSMATVVLSLVGQDGKSIYTGCVDPNGQISIGCLSTSNPPSIGVVNYQRLGGPDMVDMPIKSVPRADYKLLQLLSVAAKHVAVALPEPVLPTPQSHGSGSPHP